MYVTYNTSTGAIYGWSGKSRTPPSGHAEVYSASFKASDHKYYDASTETFSGPTDAEQDALDFQALRFERARLLAQSDWTQSNDSPLSSSKRMEWATYRQALRDLPANTTDPANPVWPTPPE